MKTEFWNKSSLRNSKGLQYESASFNSNNNKLQRRVQKLHHWELHHWEFPSVRFLFTWCSNFESNIPLQPWHDEHGLTDFKVCTDLFIISFYFVLFQIGVRFTCNFESCDFECYLCWIDLYSYFEELNNLIT